jgi:hypothetical protein
MNKYNIRAPTAINVTGPLCSKIGNQYPFIAMDYSTKKPEVYITTTQQASTTAD